jgi:hypothetical protein
MEAAPNTWGGDVADLVARWCSETNDEVALLTTGTKTSVQTLRAIGSGFRNTKMMLGSCTYGAANAAASYNGGGKSDWFLPSKDELNLLYLQKAILGMSTVALYWSSSEVQADVAWTQDFSDGTQFNIVSKINTQTVRPVRAF